MSTKRNDEELNSDELSQVTGGEDGGFNHENPSLDPTKDISRKSGDTSGDVLSDDQLSQITGGEDGGFNHENPGLGPTEGFIK
ncbi:MAG: bacteriocin [Oscillatoriophycideae cyanobacterium NC_groundwater_1537_Pr4_S-0.65um_50_18]|nr:bacteriocin [Oscillatoriophycideae cyanobacterium NC_groundwater_1537_Pr4_S-0.65um_50_18]